MASTSTQAHLLPGRLEELRSLPPELWLHIFSYLPPQDLQATTLTSSAFRLLAQPLLFTVIDISPFFLAYSGGGRILRPRHYLDKTVQRLKFYCSPRIAPAVRHCWVSPYCRAGFPLHNPRDHLDPHLVIDAVVDSIPKFVNLRQLSWHCIDISEKWWNIIRCLPITSIWLNSCTLEGTNPPSLPIQSVKLDHWAWKGEMINHVSIHEKHTHGVSAQILPLVLDPNQTRSISVPRADTSNFLVSTIAEMTPFNALRVLRIPSSAVTSPCFIRALVLCPSLEELRILPPADEQPHEILMDPLPPSALPLLSTYQGPYTHMLRFAVGRPLRGIAVWGLDAPSALCDPERLVESLYQVSTSNPTLETLHITVAYMTNNLLSAIASFPTLRHVEISSADSLPSATAAETSPPPLSSETSMIVLYILLRNIKLPPNLETLRIFTKLIHGNLDTPTQKSEASRLIEGMARTLPMLHSVEIAYGTYWTGTYQARWNRIWSSSDIQKDCLGKLSFSEHKRTIVFQGVRCRSDTNQDRSSLHMGKFPLFQWLWYLLYNYIFSLYR